MVGEDASVPSHTENVPPRCSEQLGCMQAEPLVQQNTVRHDAGKFTWFQIMKDLWWHREEPAWHLQAVGPAEDRHFPQQLFI